MSAINIAARRFLVLFGGVEGSVPEELMHAARVSMWIRWSALAFCLVEVQYRIDYGALSHILNTLYGLGMMAVNGYVYFLVRRSGTVKPVWMLALSAMDVASISFSASLSGGFSSPYFPMYYFAVAVFAWVFTAPRLVMVWTTMAAVIYSALSVAVEPGIDFSAKEEQGLFYRVLSLYAVSAAMGLIAGFERGRGQRGLERERELHRQRVEISQNIHDTTAQWAYMVGLGVEGAIDLVDDANEPLRDRLRLVADLSRSAMWDLRLPIDGGQLFRGDLLGEVLEAHAATFTAISSVPAELVQRGREPPLSTITKSLLFSIAHNALTNVIRHAQARSVVIRLDCADHQLSLAVSDDGIGLPPDFATRGHGFRNMRADAERMGGSLEVTSDGSGGGTTLVCVIPHPAFNGGT